MRRIVILLALLLPLPLASCAQKTAATTPPAEGAEPIADLKTFRQDTAAYLDAATAARPLVPAARQAKLLEKFTRAHYAPWHEDRPPFTAAELAEQFEEAVRDPGYGENARRRTADWARRLEESADLPAYPNDGRRAVTLRNTFIRGLPTLEPRYDDLGDSGGINQFDTLQETAVWASTPVRIVHRTRNGAWLLVRAPFSSGWMPAGDVAPVDAAFVKSWESLPLAAVLRDKVSVHDTAGVFRLQTHLGAVFPLTGQSEEAVEILVAVASAGGGAETRPAALSRADAATMPLELTPRNLAAAANRMVGQPYGWGGLYENRDCSSMVRDLFTPFGVWLPRNSGDQEGAGTVIPLKKLSGEEKERTILARGVPWATLIHVPGHIMLYIGTAGGRAIILHNIWGVHTRGPGGESGRHVVGRCSITTLQPGIELPNVMPREGDLRTRVDSMTLLLPEQ